MTGHSAGEKSLLETLAFARLSESGRTIRLVISRSECIKEVFACTECVCSASTSSVQTAAALLFGLQLFYLVSLCLL